MPKYIDADVLKKAFLIEGKDVCDATDEFETIWGASQELIEKVIDSAPAADVEPRQKWNPVTEGLPKEPGEYIVAYHPCYWDFVNPSVKVGIDNFRGKTTWAKSKYQRVIAWQEKPEPPKEDDE